MPNQFLPSTLHCAHTISALSNNFRIGREIPMTNDRSLPCHFSYNSKLIGNTKLITVRWLWHHPTQRWGDLKSFMKPVVCALLEDLINTLCHAVPLWKVLTTTTQLDSIKTLKQRMIHSLSGSKWTQFLLKLYAVYILYNCTWNLRRLI